MGFYGNVTNVNKTQFSFDKIYPNRYEMMRKASQDNIYPGRYVLVEYDSENAQLSDDCYRDCYLAPNGQIYIACTNNPGASVQEALNGAVYFKEEHRLKVVSSTTMDIQNNEIREGDIVKIPATLTNIDGNITERFNYSDINTPIEQQGIAIGSLNGITTLYFKARLDGGASVFDFITEESSKYIRNYNIDVAVYGNGRGWDSTVWQKVYVNNSDSYVMIAELNATMPTFGISADAPTLVPMPPHFDSDSTNRYYQVHWQPQWGFRLKAAEPKTGPVLNIDGSANNSYPNKVALSTDTNIYPSDETTIWYQNRLDQNTNTSEQYIYNPATNDWAPAVTDASFGAAVYYNKAGFDSQIITYADENCNDAITISPSGYSGHLYNKHDGTSRQTVVEDTQELSIMLPSLGNAVATMWDIVYGNEEQNQGKNRNQDIQWDSKDGLRMVKSDGSTGYIYDVDKVETLAGCINSVHDLMGMIIIDDSDNITDLSNINVDLNKIYYHDGKFYRVHQKSFPNVEERIIIHPNVDGFYQFDPDIDYYIIDISDGSDYDITPEQVKLINEVYSINQKWNKNIITPVPGITLAPEYIKMKPQISTKEYDFIEGNNYFIAKLASENDTGISLEQYEYIHNVYDENQEWNITNRGAVTGVTLGQNKPEIITNKKYNGVSGTDYYVSAITNDINAYPQSYIDELHSRFTIGEKLTLDNLNVIDGISFSEEFATQIIKSYYAVVEGVQYQVANISTNTEAYDPSYLQMLNENFAVGDIWDPTDENRNPLIPANFEELPGITIGTIINNNTIIAGVKKIPHYQFNDIYKYVITDIGEPNMSIEDINLLKEIYSIGQEWDTTNTEVVAGITLATQPLSMSYIDEYSFNPEITYQVLNLVEDRGLSADERSVLDTYTIGDSWNINNKDYIKGLTLATYSLVTAVGGIYSFVSDKEYFIIGKNTDGLTEVEISNLNLYNIGDRWDTENTAEIKGLIIGALEYAEVDNNNQYIFLNQEYFVYSKNYNIKIPLTEEELVQLNRYSIGFIYDTSSVTIVPGLILGETIIEPIERSKYDFVYGVTYYIDSLSYDVGTFGQAQIDYIHENYKVGQKWDTSNDTVVSGIGLIGKQESFEFDELVGFADTFNTIHGLILSINNLLETNNESTRDISTVRGCINTMNDIIHSFESFKPGEIAIVNRYGQIESARLETNQKESIQNYKAMPLKENDQDIIGDNYEEVGDIFAMEQQWITAKVDNETNAITIHHNFQPVTNQTVLVFKNTESELEKVEQGEAGETESAQYDDSNWLSFTESIVDKTGHVVGSIEKKIELPWGFKNFYIKHDYKGDEGNSNQVDLYSVYDENGNLAYDDNGNPTVTDDQGNLLYYDIPKIGERGTYVKPISIQQDLDFISINKWIQLRAVSASVPWAPGEEFLVNDEFTEFEDGELMNSEELPEIWAANGKSEEYINEGRIAIMQYEACAGLPDMGVDENGQPYDVVRPQISFAHALIPRDITAVVTDINNISDTLQVFDIDADEAGHITALKPHTYTLPYSYKTIAPINSSSAGFITVNADIVTANNTVDQLNISAGNRWVEVAGNNDTTTLTIAHAAPGTAATTVGNAANLTPAFGDSFLTVRAGIDQAGHVSVLETKSVKLPTNGSTLILNNYVVTSLTTMQNISNTDTIAAAFAKVQNNFNILNGNAVGSIAYAINQIVGSPKAEHNTLEKISGVLDNVNESIENINNSIKDINTFVDNINTTIGEYSITLNDNSTNTLLNIIKDLSARVAALEESATN